MRTRLAARMERLGLRPDELAGDLDLVRTGILDSLGFVDLVADLEEHTGRQVDLEQALSRKGITTLDGVLSLFA